MPDKPTYLGLLNAIAVAEARAHRYLSAWVAVTPDPGVRAVLQKVAWREGEHGMSFAKRLDELGFGVREKGDSSLDDALAVAGSTELTDLEKMEHFGLAALDGVLCAFDDVFKDHTIDVASGELLGRYIAEEFDTARLLAACHRTLCDRQGASGASAGASAGAASAASAASA
jgi:rubrerythrin